MLKVPIHSLSQARITVGLISLGCLMILLSDSSALVGTQPSYHSNEQEQRRIRDFNIPSSMTRNRSGDASVLDFSFNSTNVRTIGLLKALRPASIVSPTGPTLTATKTDNVAQTTKVNPGDTIMYTVVISNTGMADATGVTFTDSIDPNTTLVGGSLNSSPLANNDTYTASGNIPISIAAPGVLANDVDPDTGNNTGLTVTQVQGSGANVGVATNTTATGIGSIHGSVTLNSNGSFTYEPPPGFTGGNDTFTYQISDAGSKTDTGTVTITISGMVWFINNSAGGSNRGTFNNPFTSIASFNGVNSGAAPNPQPGDFIALRHGTGTYSETDGINLQDNQKVIGEAVQFSTVFTAAANSSPAYNTFASGTMTAPVIVTSAGNGVDLGSGNTARGFDIGNTPGFFGFNGGAVGSLTIGTLSKTGTGGAMNITTSGAFGSTVNFGTLESTSSASQNLNLVGVTGTLALTSAGTGFSGSAASSAAININGGSVGMTYTGNVTKANASALLNVTGGHTGTLTFNTGTLGASSTSTGLQFDNADGTYNFNGSATLTGANGVGIINGSSGTFSFGSNTTITSPSGTAFNVGSSPGTPTVTYSGNITQNTSGQRVINIDGTTGNTITFNTGTITGGANSTGVNINAANNVTFSNGMNLGTSLARMVNQALTITNGSNAAATYSLGVVSIFTTGAAKGLVATDNAGTVSSASGTLDAAGATAVQITRSSGTTPLGISLTSISVNGGADGVVLTNTNGSFTVTGDNGGSNNSSGGTIQNTTSHGISLTNAQNISLDQINIQSTGGSGVNGTRVTNFSFTNSTVNAAGDANLESGLAFNTNQTTDNNLAGTVIVTGNIITNSFYSGLDVQSGDGTITNATVSNNTITTTSNGQGINFVGLGTATTVFKLENATINQNNISGTRAAGIQVQVVSGSGGSGTAGVAGTPGDATKRINITNNSIVLPSNSTQAIAVVTGSSNSGARAKMNFLCECNGKNTGGCTSPTAAGLGYSAPGIGTIILVGNNGYSDMTGTVNNNVITANHQANVGGGNGIGGGNGVSGAGNAWTPDLTLTVTNNTMTGVDGNGILLVGRSTTGIAKLKIANNNVSAPINAGGSARPGIRVDAGNASSADDAVCLNISANTSAGSNGAQGIGVRKEGSVQTTNDFGLQGIPQTNPTNTDVVNWIQGQNPAGGGAFVINGNNFDDCNTAPPAAPDFAEQSATGRVGGADVNDGVSSDATLSLVKLVTTEADRERLGIQDGQKLLPQGLSWMVQAALERWREAGLSPDSMSRLQQVVFEIVKLSGGELARNNGTRVTIDETAGGLGWYFDQTPQEDGEFSVLVPGWEAQATEASPAFGRMDLLTVIMRQLGYFYLQEKKHVPANVRPLMEPILLPGVRRLPLDQFRITPPNTASIKPRTSESQQIAAGESVAEPAASPTQLGVGKRIERPPVRIPAEARFAMFNSATDQPIGLTGQMPAPAMMTIKDANGLSNSRATLANRVAAMSPVAPTVSVGPFTLPPGKSVTIMFNVTINALNTLPPGTSQVCNQGTVSGTNFSNVMTDDPDTVAANDSTCTQLNVADVSVTKSAGSSPVCSTSNITYTINYNNAGPAAAINALVSDAMPANTHQVSVTTPATWSRTDSVPVNGNGTITFTKASSANGDTASFTIVVSIDSSVADGAVIQNTATVSSDTPDTTPSNNTSTPTSTTVKKPPTTATVGGNQTICALGTTTGLGGNTPTIGAGTWTVQSGGTGTFNPNATTPGATFTHATGAGPVVLRWTISNPPCIDSFAEVTVTVKSQPTATVGGAQTICQGGTTAALGGNTPSGGATGTWSIVTGGVTGTFNPSATTPGATFTHTSGGVGSTITLRWTVSNPPCSDATADVSVTIKSQPTATAGGPQTICSGGTTAALGGNTPPTGATGMWSIVTGGITGTFNPDATTPGATFTHTSGSTSPFTLRWTVSNSPCTAATADVAITLQPAPISTNGGPQTICDGGTTAGLGGNTPAAGETGTWSIVTGGATGTFSPNATTPNATFTPTSGPGTITLRWTVSNATCGASATSDAVITVKQQPTATVGGPQTICALGTTAGLGGNTPAGGATGTWSIVTGGATGTFSPNANAPNATFTHSTGTGTIMLRWTVSNAPCTNATADVAITITPPPTTATVGGPQTICSGGTTASLGGNSPTTGTGMWTVQSGGTGTFNPDATTPGATFTHTSGAGPVVVRWTISNSPCPASFAEVTITIKQQPTATVGGPQTICSGGTTASLGGNTPSGGATGTWSIVTGGAAGTFNPNANTPGATFTHSAGSGTITLRWTVSNPPCSDATADVAITISQAPTTATVGGPQTICALGTTAGLGGNSPASGTGTWTVQSGGTGTFSPNASTPNATFTHTGGNGPVVVRWTISSPPCTDSFAEVTITIKQPPTTATVGGAQTICNGSTTAGLGGNTPTSGTGTWTIQSGGTGTFNPNATTPNATFTPGSGAGTYVVRWTISNPPCPDSLAEVTVTVKQQPTATTGGPQNLCAGGTTAGLGGNTPAGGATGTWSIVTGGASGTFNPNATTPNATFTHTGGSGTITLRWTVSTPPCTDATADVVLTIKQPPTTASVGPNQTIAPGGTTAPLGGNTPSSGTGLWSIATAGFTGTFNPNASTPNATWTHVSGSGQVKLRWTISNPPCPDSFAEVTIQIGVAPTITCPSNIMVNNDPNQCSASVTFTVGSTGIPAPTVVCKVGSTVITSPNSFPVGTTTVNCSGSNGVQPDANCSFTVTVKDNQLPTFPSGCPANVTATGSASCPFAAGKVVTFTTPTVSDNCPGATVACNPPSGSTFPAGTTTVTCTATDASGNMAQCTFTVTTFPMCLQDETNTGNFVLFNPVTGDFQFFCNGVLIASGTGTPNVRGCGGTINQAKGDRRVEIAFDTTANGGKGAGTATVSNPPSTVRCTILDKDMSNNTCSTPAPVAAPERGRERTP